MDPRAQKYKDEGNIKFKNGLYPEAIKDYSNAIVHAPSDFTLLGNRSASWFMLKAYKQCVDDCVLALGMNASFSTVRTRLVKALIALGQFEKAKEHLYILQKETPDNEDVKKDIILVDSLIQKLNEGNSAFEQKNYSKALSLFRELEAVASGSDTFTLRQTEANLVLGNYTQVIRDCLVVIKHDPSNADAYYLRGKGLYYMENFDQSLSHFTECLRLNPDHGNAAKDIKKLRQLVRLMKAANDFVFVRNFEDAAKSYTDALEVDPENKRLYSKLIAGRGEARYRLGDLEKALEDCRAAIKAGNDTATPYLTRANICIGLQKFDEAISTLEYVLKHIDPNNSQAMQRLNDAQFELRKFKRTNYYELMGVLSVASALEIKEAYKQRAMEWHPDKHSLDTPEEKQKAEVMFKKIQEGYEILIDGFKKDLYDKGYDLEAINEQVQMKQARERKRQKQDCGGNCDC